MLIFFGDINKVQYIQYLESEHVAYGDDVLKTKVVVYEKSIEGL